MYHSNLNMFGKHTSCGATSNVDVNLTLDLTDYVKKDAGTFTGTTTIDTLAIANSASTILGEENRSLHFDINNINGYYGFHIQTLGIDTNQEQIVFYRENNFWYFKAEENGEKLQIRAGTSFTNWNSDAFEFY